MQRLSRIGAASVVLTLSMALFAGGAAAKVLRVGTYKGVRGQYTTIQAAANAAKSGDWILIAPGDYKTSAYQAPKGHPSVPAAILLKKSFVFVRGMSRSKVIIDGTKPGTPTCSSKPSAQNFGPSYNGGHAGLNGIEVWEANNVWVQNLTTCNFPGGTGETGNQIWWNGGAGGGVIHGKNYLGSYLSATSTYFDKTERTDATYGIFSSDFDGGVFDHDYASNFNDSGFYIGGCNTSCNQTMENSQAEYNALGYSGTNSGGSMLIEHNVFDNNQDGFDTNAQNNSDWPSPQDGACPAGVKPQIAGAPTCWILYDNVFKNNDNPNVPAQGSAAAGPVGTGASLEGRDDTVIDNTFENNGAWGVVFQPYPDDGTPPANVIAAGQDCHGGTMNYNLLGFETIRCMYDDWGNALIGNTFTNNGYYGNPSNGDTAELTLLGGEPINCYSGNTDTGGFTSSPANIEQTNKCGQVAASNSSGDGNTTFLLQAACDTQALGAGVGCVPGTPGYPRVSKVVMHPLPHLPSMSDPCRGVPKNPWCPAGKKA
ncbi:MAG TPA: hypothetical protein VG228_04280 [Solirubrobacteraceae bacterium]|jgi:hypothetical protein|nr:hypothetical protein [Solirubrobacteraceae bacterium]